jgi:hypothetical protein
MTRRRRGLSSRNFEKWNMRGGVAATERQVMMRANMGNPGVSGDHGDVNKRMSKMRVRLKDRSSHRGLLDIEKTASAVSIPANVKKLFDPLRLYLKDMDTTTEILVTIDTVENLDGTPMAGLLAGRHHENAQDAENGLTKMSTANPSPGTLSPGKYPIPPRLNLRKCHLRITTVISQMMTLSALHPTQIP